MASNFKPEIVEPGTITWPYRLGDVVRDRISGIEGVAVSRLYHITGCDRFMIEPLGTDNKRGDSFAVSGERLELVKEQTEFHRDEAPEMRVGLGDVVRDFSTGMEGRVNIIEVPLFGSIRVAVEPGFDKKKLQMAEAFMFDEPFIEVLKPFKTPAEKKVDAKKEPAPAAKRGCVRMGAERAPKSRL